MNCPECGSKGYSRKTKTPEWRCRKCRHEWDVPQVNISVDLADPLRMIVDREREIQAFVPVESWTIDNLLRKAGADAIDQNQFPALLHSITNGTGRIRIPMEEEARAYETELVNADYKVAEVRKRDVRQRPSAPFTTSTMLQEAGRQLGYVTSRTMTLANQLYEGLSVGSGGSVGLITSMITDSTQVDNSAISEVREYIQERYGIEYIPDNPRTYTNTSESAQEASEAIRPTSIMRTPESLKDYLSTGQLSLYTLIWSRMVASQMEDAISEATTLNIDATCKGSNIVYSFRASGSVLKFAVFRTVYIGHSIERMRYNTDRILPALSVDDALDCSKIEANQHFTEPPPRFTEATLIKLMEEKGIGRPSTYAPTIGTLVDSGYVKRMGTGRIIPTPFGMRASDAPLSETGDPVLPTDPAVERFLHSIGKNEDDIQNITLEYAFENLEDNYEESDLLQSLGKDDWSELEIGDLGAIMEDLSVVFRSDGCLIVAEHIIYETFPTGLNLGDVLEVKHFSKDNCALIRIIERGDLNRRYLTVAERDEMSGYRRSTAVEEERNKKECQAAADLEKKERQAAADLKRNQSESKLLGIGMKWVVFPAIVIFLIWGFSNCISCKAGGPCYESSSNSYEDYYDSPDRNDCPTC